MDREPFFETDDVAVVIRDEKGKIKIEHPDDSSGNGATENILRIILVALLFLNPFSVTLFTNQQGTFLGSIPDIISDNDFIWAIKNMIPPKCREILESD